MSTTKYILGTVAIVGASLYVYDQRAQGANFEYEKLKQKNSNALDSINDKAQEIKAIGENKSDKISKELSSLKEKASNQLDSAFASAKGKKNEVVDKAEETKEESKGFFNNLFTADKKPIQIEEEKGVLRKASASYLDKVNEIGNSISRSISGETEAEQIARQAKNDAKEHANSWWNWGSSKADDAKGQAISDYEKAKNSLIKAKKDALDTGNSWVNWGKEKSEDIRQRHNAKVAEAEETLKKAQANLKQYGQDLYDQLTKEYSVEDERALARANYNSLRGWGDSAATFAEDELRLVDDYNKRPVDKVNWGDDLFNKSKELSEYAKNKAQQNYDSLKAELDKQQKNASGWFSSQGKEVEKQGNQAVEELEAKLKEAQNQLDKCNANAKQWADSALKQTADATQSAIDATKSGLKTSHDSIQSGLNSAKEWVDKK